MEELIKKYSDRLGEARKDLSEKKQSVKDYLNRGGINKDVRFSQLVQDRDEDRRKVEALEELVRDLEVQREKKFLPLRELLSDFAAASLLFKVAFKIEGSLHDVSVFQPTVEEFDRLLKKLKSL